MPIFLADDDRTRFLSQLRDNLQTHTVILLAYVLMDDHYHLLLRTPRANLSRFMQRLNTSYALYARHRHGRPGRQLQGRFKAKIVQDDACLAGVSRHIHLNPVKTAACQQISRRERVRLLEGYRWSSYPGYVDESREEDFLSYEVLRQFASEAAAARSRYRGSVEAYVFEDDRPTLDALKASRHAIGDPSFIEKIEAELHARRAGGPQERVLPVPASTVDIEVIDAYVCRRYGLQPADLKAHGRRAGLAKFVAVELACRWTGMNQRAVGAHYGNVTSSAVGAIRKKVREGRYDVADIVEQFASRIAAGNQSAAASQPKTDI